MAEKRGSRKRIKHKKISKLKELYNEGLITYEEFQLTKKEALNSFMI